MTEQIEDAALDHLEARVGEVERSTAAEIVIVFARQPGNFGLVADLSTDIINDYQDNVDQIDFSGLGLTFGDLTFVDIARGEAVGLVGESGCGKPTLGRIVAGVVMVGGLFTLALFAGANYLKSELTIDGDFEIVILIT